MPCRSGQHTDFSVSLPIQPGAPPPPPSSPPVQEFEKKEPRVKARAATNLAFLYFLEGEVEHADKYSELALHNDK
jgi:hypothetical protein